MIARNVTALPEQMLHLKCNADDVENVMGRVVLPIASVSEHCTKGAPLCLTNREVRKQNPSILIWLHDCCSWCCPQALGLDIPISQESSLFHPTSYQRLSRILVGNGSSLARYQFLCLFFHESSYNVFCHVLPKNNDAKGLVGSALHCIEINRAISTDIETKNEFYTKQLNVPMIRKLYLYRAGLCSPQGCVCKTSSSQTCLISITRETDYQTLT